MSDAWKNFERRVAKKLGGERIPVADKRSHLDVINNEFAVECKYRKKLSMFLKDAIMQAEEGRGDKMPIVALGEKYSSDIFIMLKIENFLKLIGEKDEHGTRFEKTFSDPQDQVEKGRWE
jgi:hypothetical protein